jgi:phosphohistidine phosphatase
MKTLYLLRHAKSSWDYPGLSDHRRPLNKRGETDAPRMGKWLQEHAQAPDWVYCSDAARTLSTFARVNQFWNIPKERLQISPELYLASTAQFWKTLHTTSANIGSILIVGHNPGITDFANELGSDFFVDNMPTCALAAFRFSVDNWQDIKPQSGSPLFYQTPKELD